MSGDIETLIKEFSEEMAARMLRAAETAASEEDIRHECNKLLDEFVTRAGLSIKGRHEYGLAGGRVDSKYGGVVIEYKFPKGIGRIGESREAPGSKAVVEQVQQRFLDLRSEENVELERIFGVGCDGRMLVFVRSRAGAFEAQPPQPVTSITVERWLRALVSVGAHGLSFTPENLALKFGSESNSARESIRNLHDLIGSTDNPKAQTFFRQWQVLFGEVCGYDIHAQSARVKKLADHYSVKNPKSAELLFAVHTYYAILIKLLAAEIVSPLLQFGPSPLKRLIEAPTSEKLHGELLILEQGGIWSQVGILNLLEGDLFAWYLDAWDERCASAVREMVRALDDFDPTTLAVEAAESRDLLKQLYQQLFPRSIRHDLGEYYTPDWLADLVLDELGYDGNPDTRLLDPACGSGTFLVMAINRVKTWFSEHRHDCGFREGELLKKITRNVIGFDLNPLAVMAARTNYLMAIRDLVRQSGGVELPVYLCDSILTPSEHGDLFTGGHGKTRRVRTSEVEFIIPNEIAENPQVIGAYTNLLESCIRDRHSPEEFLKRCEVEAIPAAEKHLHRGLYVQLQELAAANKNGVWARIIKNAFAPLFVGKVDLIAGNPPWVNWESLPGAYRDAMKPLWQEYGLFTLSGSAGRLGGGKKDLSMLFVYSAVDNYLEVGGKLGFVITESVFKTKGAGDGFRRLEFHKKEKTVRLRPLEVHDLSAMQVFEGATNRTAVFVCEKSKRAFSYPVKYTVWRGVSRIPQEVDLAEAKRLANPKTIAALPVDPKKSRSPWMTAPESALSGIQKVLGKSHYQAHAGCCTWLNGVFWIRILATLPNGNLVIENLHDVGKIAIKKVEWVIEPDLVYPLLRGRDVHRWRAEPSAHIILAQDPKTRRGIPESVMKLKYPKTFSYFRQFEGDPKNPEHGTLRGRSGYRKYFKPTDPFYSMYNVGPYTVLPIRVFWRQFIPQIRMSLCLEQDDPQLGRKVPLTQHVVTFCPFGSKTEAFYFAACGNSSPATLLHSVSSTGKSFGQPLILEMIRIPKYKPDTALHKTLAQLSREAHRTAKEGHFGHMSEIELEIDRYAAKLWGMNLSELRAIQESLAELGICKPTGENPDTDGDED